MPDTTKHIASLDFDIKKANAQLEELSKKLEEIALKSEGHFNKVAQNVEKSLEKVNFDKMYDKQIESAQLSQKQLSRINEAGEKERKKQEEKTKGQLERQEKTHSDAMIKIATQHNNRMIEMEQRKADQLELIDAKSNANRLSSLNNFKDMALGLGLGVGSTAMAFNLLRETASDTIQAISDVQFRMMEISRIMADGSINVQEYRDQLVGLAFEYGRSFDDVSDATLRFARAGYSADESIMLTRQAMLALNTAELDASEATDGMISVMAQWGLNADTAEETAANLGATIDKINKVADNFPITSEGLLEALQRTSQGFNLTGATIEETIAMIVAAEKEAQRGGRVIGTAMGNMVQQLKAEGKLNLAEQLGLNFYTDETKQQFKSVTGIFQEMSERMAKLKEEGKESSTEMQSLLELFTVFRRNIGAGLLNEMSGETSTYQKVLDTLSESLGYSAQENSKYMNTMEAAKQQLDAIVLDMQNTLGDQGGKQLFTGLILGAEGGIKAINSLVKSFGLIPTAVGMVILAYNLLSKNTLPQKMLEQRRQVEQLRQVFNEYNKTLQQGYTREIAYSRATENATKEQKEYLQSLKEGPATMTGYNESIGKMTLGTLAAKTAVSLLKSAIGFGLSLAIQGALQLIENWAKALENATQSLSEINDTMDATESNTENYVTQFENLRKELDGGKLTQEEFNKKKKELIALEEELVKKYGKEAEGLNLVTGSIDEQSEAIRNLRKQEYNDYLKKSESDIKKVADELNTVFTETPSFDLSNYTESVKDFLKNLPNELEGIGTTDLGLGDSIFSLEVSGTPEEIIEKYKAMYDLLAEYRKNASQEDLESIDNAMANISGAISKVENMYSKSMQEQSEFLQNRLELDDKYSEVYANIVKARSDLQEAALKNDIEGIDVAKQNLADAYQAAIDVANEQETYLKDGMVNMLEENLKNLQDTAEKNKVMIKFEGVPELKEAVEEIIQDMGDISMQDLEEAFNTGEITENMQLLKDVLDAAGISVGDFFNNVESLNLQLEETEPYVYSATEALEDMLQATTDTYAGLEGLTSQFETVYTAMNQFNENGYITAEMLTNLTANNLLQYLDMVDGKLSINEAAMVNAANAAKQKAISDLQEKAAVEIMGIANADAAGKFGTVATAADQARGPLEWIKQKVAEVAAQVRGGTADWIAYYKAMEGGKGGYENLSAEAQAEVDRIIANTQAQIDIINSMDIQGVAYDRVQAAGSGYSGGSGGSGSSGRTSTSSTTEEKNTILKDFKDMISEREKEEQRWVKKYKELEQLSYNDQKYILQQEVKRYKEYADEVMKLTGVTEEEKLKARKEYLQKAEDLELDYIDLLEKELKDETKKIKDGATERINSIKETAKAQIDALKKVEDENDRIREKEEYLQRRDEIIHGHQGIEYWEQRTGRAAQLALAEARKNLADLDREWKEKQEGWDAEDQIAAIEARRDADIAATEAERDAQIAALEEAFNYRVKQFAETGKLIYDDATIQSKNLYNTYKKNFIDPIGSELRQALAQQATTPAQSSSGGTQDYIIQWGDTLTSIANKFGTTIAAIMSANPYVTNPNLIYAGASLKIPKSHTGSKVIQDGLVNLQAGEIVLNTKWARDLDRMLEAYASKASTNNTVNNGNTVNVKGDMMKIEATIEDKSDINTLARKVKKTLERQFSIN